MGKKKNAPTGEQESAAPKKLTKKEKKLLDKRKDNEQRVIEDALVKQGRLKTRVRYERRSFLWNALVISLVFLFGIFAGLGGLIGGIYFAGKKFSVKNVMTGIGMDYTQYVNEAYAEMSLIDLIEEVVKEVQSTESLSLDVIGKYSPFVKTQIQNIADIMADAGITLNVDGLMATPFSDLGAYFQEEVVQKIELGGVLGVTAESDGMMLSLCYGKEGVDYDIVEGKIVPRATSENYPLTVGVLEEKATEVIYGMELGSLLNIDPAQADSIMMSLCYGKEGIDYTVESNKVVPVEGGKPAATLQELIDDASGLIGELEVEAVLNVNADSSSTMRYLAYGTEAEKDENGNYVTDEQGNVSSGNYYISSEGEKKTIVMRVDPENGKPFEKRTVDSLKDDSLIEGAAIGDLVTIDENSSGLMQAISHWTIGDMKNQSKIESLNVGDVLDISPDATGLMAAIKEWTIGNLKQQHRIERLKISDVITSGDNPSKLFQAIGSWRIKDLTAQGKIDTLTISDMLNINEDSPQILKSLAETSLGEFNTAVKTLPLKDLLGDDLEKNKLLRTLQYSTVETLSDDLKHLSIGDVFTEEIYSYATNYSAGTRPLDSDKIAAENVISGYTVDNKEVIKGYFTKDGANYSILAEESVMYDALIAKENREENAVYRTPYYTERRVMLKPVYTWYLVNYDTGELEPIPEYLSDLPRHPVEDSDDEAYILLDGTDENGDKTQTRYDLERVTTYIHTDGSPLTEEEQILRVHSETDKNTENTVYYILERIEVYERFYEEAHSELTYENAVLHFTTESGETVTRYLSGLWYILLGEDASAAENTKILDIAANMTSAVAKMNHITLGEMYAHEIIESVPDVDISKIPNRGTEKENLKDLSITEVIAFVTSIAQSVSGS